MFSLELAKRLSGTGITANCFHPGVISTKLLHAAFSGGDPVAEGAQNTIHCAVSHDFEGISGKYFRDREWARPAAAAYDGSMRKRLWDLS